MTTATMTEVPISILTLPVKPDWQIGFDLYAAGYSDSRCDNYAQVVGWYAACYQVDDSLAGGVGKPALSFVARRARKLQGSTY